MNFKKLHLIIFLITVFTFGVQSQDDLPEAPKRLVSDRVGILSNQEVSSLERKLVAFNDTNSTQIAILITGDLHGYDIADYSQRVAQKWGIGQKKYDNGAIIVVKPKTPDSRGEANIDVGYGLEPLIPDITAKRIVENEMIPRFKNNDYYGGLDAATDVMMSLTAGKFTADQYKRQTEGSGLIGYFVPILVLIIVITMINRGRSRHSTIGRRGSSSALWTALFLGSMMGGGHRGTWGNFQSGSGGFGGGGGFGGFGGGSFGGGGASGSW